MADLARRRTIGGKYYYFHGGHKTKRGAQTEAKKQRNMGYGARIVPSGGWYYVYTTMSAGWRPNK